MEKKGKMLKKLFLMVVLAVFTFFLNAEEAGQKKIGWISVTTVPAGLNVYVDGKQIGKTPLVKLEVETGNRVISIEVEPCFKNTLFYTWNKNVFIEPGMETTVEILPDPVMTKLQISSMEISGKKIEGHPVYVDGKMVGTQPGDLDVPLCSKLLEITDISSNKVIYSSELDLLAGKITERKEKGYEIVMSESREKPELKTLASKELFLQKTSRKSSDFDLKFRAERKKITGPYKWTGAGLIIGGIITAGLGGLFDWKAYDEFDKYEKMGRKESIEQLIMQNTPDIDAYVKRRDSHYNSGEKYSVTRTVLYVLGGASFTTGIILLFVPGKKNDGKSPVITASPSTDGIFFNSSINF